MTNHRAAFNKAKKSFGENFGEKVIISSVSYGSLDQTPTVLYSRMVFLEPEGPQFAQTPLPNGSYYCCHCDFNFVEPGYVITPTESGSSSPILTVLSKAFLGEIVAFRTSRLGAIYNGETLLYNNIYWDVCPTSFTSNFPLSKEFKATPHVPVSRVNLYYRDLRLSGVSGYDTEGLMFVEIDRDPLVFWQINEACTVGGIMQLDLELSRNL